MKADASVPMRSNTPQGRHAAVVRLPYQFNNATYEAWFGVSPEQVKGRPLVEVLGRPAYDRIKPYVERVLGGETVRFDSVIPYSAGPVREIEAVYIPHLDASGSVLGFYSLVEDVNELSDQEG